MPRLARGMEISMSLIKINNLSFSYEDSNEAIFKNISLDLDTTWRLALIGRNGKGKSTLLKILDGSLSCSGEIKVDDVCKYYPYNIEKKCENLFCYELINHLEPTAEVWRVVIEAENLALSEDFLEKKYGEMSSGEQVKFTLALLFSIEKRFLLIDEPTNHLDEPTKKIIGQYLNKKSGFILVSHDREVLDMCVDHILVLNRETITLQKGNFSSWYENKICKDNFELAENKKINKEIKKLQDNRKKIDLWAKRNESTKIGFDPRKEPDRCKDTRAYIGGKTKKLNKRVTALDDRISKKINNKEALLKDIEEVDEIKLNYKKIQTNQLMKLERVNISYDNIEDTIIKDFNLCINEGDCVCIAGKNGSGKSTLIKYILNEYNNLSSNAMWCEGNIKFCPNLQISYISQTMEWNDSTVEEYIRNNDIDKSLFLTLLTKLGIEVNKIISKPVNELSDGEKKKVQIAISLITPANLYIWDEPLNYLDIYSRIQIEKMILKYRPTMLIVDHDDCFIRHCSTKIIVLNETFH